MVMLMTQDTAVHWSLCSLSGLEMDKGPRAEPVTVVPLRFDYVPN